MKRKEGRQKRLIFVVLKRLAIIAGILAFGLLVLLSFVFYHQAKDQALKDTASEVEDISGEVKRYFKGYIYDTTLPYFHDLEELKNKPGDLNEILNDYTRGKSLTDDFEFNIIDRNGIIIASTNDQYVGYDMHDGEQSSDFVKNMESKPGFFMQDFRSVSYDENVKMLYAGWSFSDGSGILEVGITEKKFFDYLYVYVPYAVENRRLQSDGYILIVNRHDAIIAAYHDEHVGQTARDAGIALEPGHDYNFEFRQTKVFGVDSYVVVNSEFSGNIIGVYPIGAMIGSFLVTLRTVMTYLFIVFILLFVSVFLMIKRTMVDSLEAVAGTMTSITDGNLDEKVDVHTTAEFDSLSSVINKMVDALKRYIEEEKTRNAKELGIAREIQLSAMPNHFPPFPDRKEFSIFASMNAAAEVGGDFYDFYLLGDKLVFLIADVSGKGIPAAMFMMRAKTVIKHMAELDMEPGEVFTKTNRKLCEGNDSGMFVTAWIGFLDIKTGVVRIANAGHNPALYIREGAASYMSLKPGLMLGAFDMFLYQTQEIRLAPGDCVFLYTDGVTEAEDVNGKLYGEARLQEILSRQAEAKDADRCKDYCESVLDDVRKFSEGAKQADDITMLCIRYEGQN